MKTFQEWSGQEDLDLFEMANVITKDGQPEEYKLGGLVLKGPGVVNVLKDLDGVAKIHDLAMAMLAASTVKLKNTDDTFTTLAEFADVNDEPLDKLLAYLAKGLKSQLRKQKVGWKDRIATDAATNAWMLTADAEAPKRKGGGAKGEDYTPGFAQKD